MKQLTFVTWNIEDGMRFFEIVDFLKGVEADVIQLQESGTSGRGQTDEEFNLHEALMKALNMGGIYRRMFWADDGRGKFDVGLTTLTKFKILDEVTHGYEADETEEVIPVEQGWFGYPRKLLGLKLDLDGLHHWFFNTHSTVTKNAEVTQGQLESASAIRRFLAPYDNYLLSGDMNTPFNTETYRVLSEGLSDVSKPELPTLHPTIHPAGHMRYHVDYVFLKGKKLVAEKSEVPIIDASDHLPVVVRLSRRD